MTTKRAADAKDSSDAKRQKQNHNIRAGSNVVVENNAAPVASQATTLQGPVAAMATAPTSTAATLAATSSVPGPATPDVSNFIYQLLYKNCQSADKDVVLAAVTKLDDLTDPIEVGDAGAKRNSQHVIALGGYYLAKLILEKWSDVSDVQYHVLGFLINMSHYDVSTRRRPFLQVGLLKQVLEATGNHHADHAIASSALNAIGNMIAGNEELVKHLVEDLSGIVTVIGILKQFHCHDTVQDYGSFVLHHISKYEAFRAAIISAGGVQAMGVSMERFQNDPSLQQWARKVLADLIGSQL